jgi:hypothetical protein
MIDATIDVWLCKGCERFSRIDAEKCENRYCRQPKPDAVTIHQIGLNSPAAMELLGNTGKGAKNAAKGSKTAKTSGSKQRGKKIDYDGHTFDSKIEFERYLHLKECLNAGTITHLRVHPCFEIAPAVKLPISFLPKKTQGAITYTPDFSYMLNDMEIYEDTKGAYGNSKKNVANGKAGKPIVTEAARLRHKLFIAKLAAQVKDFHFRLVTVATEAVETLFRQDETKGSAA